ncbi:MAG: hypothetical protein QXV17_14320 [Candidatus Micrarchaeaceae archaeon]
MIDFLNNFIEFFTNPNKEKIRLLTWYYNKPKILSLFFYIQNKYDEHYYVNQVSKWLKEIFKDRVSNDEHIVKLDNVVVFSIFISNKHYYKKRNLNYIKMQMKVLLQDD